MGKFLDGSSGASRRFGNMISDPDLQTLCDVVFVLGDEKFPAHRAVLACSSPVFRKMFTTGMREAIRPEVPLEIPVSDLDPVSWEVSLRYMYTGQAFLRDEETALVALSSAHKYQLEELCGFLESFLVERCKTENCTRFYNASQVYDLKKLESTCLCFIDEHFEELSRSANFLEECEKDLFTRIIGSKKLIIKSEATVLNCITAWIQPDVEGRSPYLEEMLKMVQLSKVTELDLTLMGRKTMTFPCESFQSVLLEKWVSEKPEAESEEILDHLIPRQRSSKSFTLTHRLLDKDDFIGEENTPWKPVPDRNVLIRLKVNPFDDENFSCPRCKKRYRDSAYCDDHYRRRHKKAENHGSRKYLSLYLESEPMSLAFIAKLKLKFFVINRKEPASTFSRSLECATDLLRRRYGFFEFILLEALQDYVEGKPKSVLLGVNVVLS